jgi:hypothetical protein
MLFNGMAVAASIRVTLLTSTRQPAGGDTGFPSIDPENTGHRFLLKQARKMHHG